MLDVCVCYYIVEYEYADMHETSILCVYMMYIQCIYQKSRIISAGWFQEPAYVDATNMQKHLFLPLCWIESVSAVVHADSFLTNEIETAMSSKYDQVHVHPYGSPQNTLQLLKWSHTANDY